MHYDELKNKAEHYRKHTATKTTSAYHYARSKGFDSREATFLQFKTKEEIDQIAKERDVILSKLPNDEVGE